MKGRTRTALGIDVGADRISLVLVRREASEYKVVRAVSRPIVHDGSSSRGTADIAAFSRTLRKLRRQARVPTIKAAMGISVSPLVLQMLDMPKQMPQNVREFVENELGQYVTLSGKAIMCDFCVVNSSRDSHRQLLSVAGEIDAIRDLVKACGSAGLVVATVEPSILAYARARCRQRETNTPAGKVLVVEVGASQLSACLLRRGTLDFVRTRSVPTELESPEAANAWLLEEIETMMRHCDCESPGTGDAWEVDILARNGAAVTQEIAESLRTRTGVLPQVVADGADSNRTTAGGEDYPLASMTACGLAMKCLESEGDAWRINLLPQEIVQARSLVRYGLTAATAACILFVLMMLSLTFVTRAADSKRRGLYLEQVAKQLYAAPALGMQTLAIDRQTEWAQRQLMGIKQAFAGHSQKDWSSLLQAVAENMPSDTCITRLWSADAQRLFIRGLAMSSNSVHGFAQSLSKGGAFESVSVESLNRQRDGSLVEYEMYCLMKSTP